MDGWMDGWMDEGMDGGREGGREGCRGGRVVDDFQPPLHCGNSGHRHVYRRTTQKQSVRYTKRCI